MRPDVVNALSFLGGVLAGGAIAILSTLLYRMRERVRTVRQTSEYIFRSEETKKAAARFLLMQEHYILFGDGHTCDECRIGTSIREELDAEDAT